MRLRQGANVGAFRIEKLVSNQGATAHVYLASGGGRQVILKIARGGEQDYLFQDYLRHEVEVLRQFQHTSIVQPYPVLGENVYAARAEMLPHKPWYIALEYVAGKALNTHIRQITRSFPLAWRVRLFERVVEAVAYLHEQGYAHGDLKPDHILLREPPNLEQMPQPVLIDFGSACAVDAAPDSLSASIPYGAPELLHALDDSTRQSALRPAALDVWALGAMLYELVVGTRLIRGFTRRAMKKHTLQGKFDIGKAPHAMQPLLAKMLTMQPEQRASIQEVRGVVGKIK